MTLYILNEDDLDVLNAHTSAPRVGVLAPLDKRGRIDLCDRWAQSFLDEGMDVFYIPVDIKGEDQILKAIDALLLPGGDSNIHPSNYGKAPLKNDLYDLPRDKFSFNLVQKAYDLDLPTMGVCRGMQEMIVSFGGALCDLEDGMINHAKGYAVPKVNGRRCQKKMDERVHHVVLLQGSTLNTIFGNKQLLNFNSIHKQGVTRDMWCKPMFEKARSVFKIMAMAPDGVVEAVEARGKRCFMGFQAHVELPGQYHDCLYAHFINHINEYYQDNLGRIRMPSEVNMSNNLGEYA